jgi:hypothetical protein
MKKNVIIKQSTVNENRSAMGDLVLAICSKSSEEIVTQLREKAMQNVWDDKRFHLKRGKDYLDKPHIAFGIDSQAPLAESVGSRYAVLAVKFCQDLIIEYDCKTPSEKATAQLVANAYVRVMECSQKIEYCIHSKETTNMLNNYWAVIGKELDRAERHYMSALTKLEQVKAPSLQIKVTAKNAFIAQNQQVNSNQTK